MRWGLLALLGCGGPDEEPLCTGDLGATWYRDADGDGAGDLTRFVTVCDGSQPLGHVLNVDDCDDGNAATFPLAPEICDGEDNDCDGPIDEALPFYTWFVDEDGDGWGTGVGEPACRAPEGWVRHSGDCDDTSDVVHPTADEVCDGVDNDCDGLPDDADPNLSAAGASAFHPDLDGDGFGDSFSLVFACVQPVGTVSLGGDCDDLSAEVYTGAPELCDGVDNDCDSLIDDLDPDIDPTSFQTWYFDGDQDGFGDPDLALTSCTQFGFYVADHTDCDDTRPEVGGPATTAWLEDLDGDGVGAGVPALTGCVPPGPDWVGTWLGADCDDTDVRVSPLEIEVCDGLDNNCVDGIDEEDPALDLDSADIYYPDLDFDGFGGLPVYLCSDPGGTAVDGGDCDDGDPDVFPGQLEICNGGIDDDCNGMADDFDSLLDPATEGLFVDADGDGFGNGALPLVACEVAPGRADNPDDCDDAVASIGASTLWWTDGDGDGFGTGPTEGPACVSPLINGASVDLGEDCDDSLGFVFPGASDLCGDGIDQDCSGADRPCPRTDCAALLADGLSTGDGVYTIDPTGAGARDVWCDMTTDGGGWTLVSSSTSPVDDQADGYSPELATLAPSGVMAGLWDGLRDVVPGNSDIRFACKTALEEPFVVDLVMYDIHWYRELTSGTESEVCFNEDNGAGADDPAPRRLNVLTGAVRELGNPWDDDGYLEGEDSCDSPDDFTVDFDDRGMDSNQFDGTDWGEDDGAVKCGVTNVGAAWFVFVR